MTFRNVARLTPNSNMTVDNKTRKKEKKNSKNEK